MGAALSWACASSETLTPAGTGGTGAGAARGGTTSSSGGTTSTLGGTTSTLGGTTATLGGTTSTLGGTTSSGGTTASGGVGGVPDDVLARAEVVVHYLSGTANAATLQIDAKLNIENKSADPLPLANVELRYWMTSEATSLSLKSYYQGPSISGATLTWVEAGEDSYIQFTFSGKTITKGADLNASEIQMRVDGSGSTQFDQSNDWSWEPNYSTRSPHDRITAYLAGKLVWGCEPSGTCAGDGAGGAGGAGGGTSGGQGGATGSGGDTGEGGTPSEGGTLGGGAGGQGGA